MRWLTLQHAMDAVRVSARVVLAADGLGGKLAARAGVAAVETAPGARIGAGVVADDAPAFYRPGEIFMACGPHGYLGLVRLEDGRLDLAAALAAEWVRTRGGLGRVAVEMLAESDWPAIPNLAQLGWQGTPALTRRSGRLAAERLFLIGDAAGYVEPFTGEGIAWALATGAAVAPLAARAAQRWHSGLIAEWTAVHRRLIQRRQFVCRTLAAVLRSPGLTSAMVGLLSHAPALASPVVRYLGTCYAG